MRRVVFSLRDMQWNLSLYDPLNYSKKTSDLEQRILVPKGLLQYILPLKKGKPLYCKQKKSWSQSVRYREVPL